MRLTEKVMFPPLNDDSGHLQHVGGVRPGGRWLLSGGRSVCWACCAALWVGAQAAAQAPVPARAPVAISDGRAVLVLPDRAGRMNGNLDSGPYVVESRDAGSRREHRVRLDGETFRALTPRIGPASRIAFDPSRRTFAALLPSLRVELAPGVDLDAVAGVVRASRITRFDSLGFAILQLPGDLHPADAAARVAQLPARPAAGVRLRGPGIDWR